MDTGLTSATEKYHMNIPAILYSSSLSSPLRRLPAVVSSESLMSLVGLSCLRFTVEVDSSLTRLRHVDEEVELLDE